MKPKHNKTNNKESYSHQHDYPVEEVWNTYHILSQIIAPRLQSFKALEKHGYCPYFKGMCEWNNAIQKMIDAFELLKYAASYTEDEERRIEQGLDLFRKFYRNLWD